MKIVDDVKKGMNLTSISKKESCTKKTSKKWVGKYKGFVAENKNRNQKEIDEVFDVP